MISFKHFVLIFIFFQGVLFFAQENTNVKVIIKLRPIENFRGKLKNCTSSVFENNVLVSKKIIQYHTIDTYKMILLEYLNICKDLHENYNKNESKYSK